MKPQERGQNRKYRIQWPISFYHILISPYFPFWICQKWVIKTMRHRQLRRPPRDRSPRRSQGLSCHRGRSWMQLRRLRRIPSPLIFLDTPQMKPWFSTGSIHVGVQKMGKLKAKIGDEIIFQPGLAGTSMTSGDFGRTGREHLVCNAMIETPCTSNN